MYLKIMHVLEAGLVPDFRFASSKTTRTNDHFVYCYQTRIHVKLINKHI